jgi:hypothetical protein
MIIYIAFIVVLAGTAFYALRLGSRKSSEPLSIEWVKAPEQLRPLENLLFGKDGPDTSRTRAESDCNRILDALFGKEDGE